MKIRVALSLAAMAAVAVGAAGCHKKSKDMNGKIVSYPGSYHLTCRNVVDQPGGVISADCADAKGLFHSGTIKASNCQGDLANINGVLSCNGAVAVMSAQPAAAETAASSAPAKP